MAQAVHDAISNKPETLQHHANFLASSQNRLRVFQEIYRGRGKPKTAKAIASAIGLSQKAVLGAGQQLIDANMAVRDTVAEGGRAVIGYAKQDFCRANRDEILRLVANPKRRKEMPTKRNPLIKGGAAFVSISFPAAVFDVGLITID